MSWSKGLLLIVLLSMVQVVSSQTISVTTDQGLGFGDFTQISDLGGTVTISNTGSRSSTGSITLIGASSAWYYSIFMITTQSSTPIIVTMDEPTATLSGSNGGSMSLQMDISDPESPSVSEFSPAEVHIGGTLILGSRSENPPGIYSGNVLITFTANYE